MKTCSTVGDPRALRRRRLWDLARPPESAQPALSRPLPLASLRSRGRGGSTLALLALLITGPAAHAASLTVVSERFVLTMEDGQTLTSTQLIGAELTTAAGQMLRIDAVTPAKERPGVLLHSLSLKDPATGAWTSACQADAYGRQAGFPVSGSFDAAGHYHRDPGQWFLTCTSGAQAKCILWGYDPWGHGPHGEDLARYYQACQYTVRANYDGRGEAHTRNGTSIDVFDAIGVTTSDTAKDPDYAFEAGWGPNGAVCVARTRWPELLSRAALLKSAPHLAGPCDVAAARRRGALIFTRVMKTPVIKPPK